MDSGGSARSGIFDCRWAWCRLVFSSNAELVRHVISEHVRKSVPLRRSELAMLRRIEEGSGASLSLYGLSGGGIGSTSESATNMHLGDTQASAMSSDPEEEPSSSLPSPPMITPPQPRRVLPPLSNPAPKRLSVSTSPLPKDTDQMTVPITPSSPPHRPFTPNGHRITPPAEAELHVNTPGSHALPPSAQKNTPQTPDFPSFASLSSPANTPNVPSLPPSPSFSSLVYKQRKGVSLEMLRRATASHSNAQSPQPHGTCESHTTSALRRQSGTSEYQEEPSQSSSGSQQVVEQQLTQDDDSYMDAEVEDEVINGDGVQAKMIHHTTKGKEDLVSNSMDCWSPLVEGPADEQRRLNSTGKPQDLLLSEPPSPFTDVRSQDSLPNSPIPPYSKWQGGILPRPPQPSPVPLRQAWYQSLPPRRQNSFSSPSSSKLSGQKSLTRSDIEVPKKRKRAAHRSHTSLTSTSESPSKKDNVLTTKPKAPFRSGSLTVGMKKTQNAGATLYLPLGKRAMEGEDTMDVDRDTETQAHSPGGALHLASQTLSQSQPKSQSPSQSQSQSQPSFDSSGRSLKLPFSYLQTQAPYESQSLSQT